MAERTIGKNIHGQPIFYGSAADLAAKTAVLDTLAEFWLPDGSRYQSNGAGGWIQTRIAGAGLVAEGLLDNQGNYVVPVGVITMTYSAGILATKSWTDGTYTWTITYGNR